MDITSRRLAALLLALFTGAVAAGEPAAPADGPAGARARVTFKTDDGAGNVQTGSGTVVVTSVPGESGPPKKVAFLGVVTSPVSRNVEAVKKAGLPEGVGLLVDHIKPDSPAAAAGLTPSDVLQKFNDQVLVTPAQLSVLVRLQQPGDPATLTVIRERQERKLSVRLGEQMIGLALGGTERITFQVGLPHWSYARADGEHTIRMTNDGAMTKVVVTDKAGQQVFEGPCDSDQQRAAMPPEIRKKVESMLQTRAQATISIAPAAEQLRPGALPQAKAAVVAAAAGNVAAPPAKPQAIVAAASPASGPVPPIRYFDGGKWYVLTVRDGQKHLLIQNPQGQDLFTAPVEREEQRQQLAKEVLDKLRFMENTVNRPPAAKATPSDKPTP